MKSGARRAIRHYVLELAGELAARGIHPGIGMGFSRHRWFMSLLWRWLSARSPSSTRLLGLASTSRPMPSHRGSSALTWVASPRGDQRQPHVHQPADRRFGNTAFDQSPVAVSCWHQHAGVPPSRVAARQWRGEDAVPLSGIAASLRSLCGSPWYSSVDGSGSQ